MLFTIKNKPRTLYWNFKVKKRLFLNGFAYERIMYPVVDAPPKSAAKKTKGKRIYVFMRPLKQTNLYAPGFFWNAENGKLYHNYQGNQKKTLSGPLITVDIKTEP